MASKFTRGWLREFLHLGARSELDGVPAADVERQEDTVLRSLELLEERPGLVLADEVGMGKTFEALGVMAARLREKPDSRICVVTPGPDLNGKWLKAIHTAGSKDGLIYNFEDSAATASTMAELIDVQRKHAIALAPISAFQGARGGADQEYLLSLFADWKNLHGATTNALFARFRQGKLTRVTNVRKQAFLDAFSYDVIAPHLDAAFGSEGPEDRGLSALFDLGGGVEAFEQDAPVKKALDLARFRLVRALMPDITLLVIDEAHKLKNPESLRNRAVSTVFDRKFDHALFLTATPFQLHIEELRQVFGLFGRAKTAPPTMEREVQALFDAIDDYQRGYDDLEQQWRHLDAGQAALFAQHYAEDAALASTPRDITLAPVIAAIRNVRTIKETEIEPNFRRWMVRSIHQEKREYRRHSPQVVPPTGDSLLPFLIYERFIAELFRTADSTHKAAVEINMVSSFEAAAHGSLFAEERKMHPSADTYRQLLEKVLAKDNVVSLRDHPKLGAVVDAAMDAAERAEKTLIFCGRTQTISRLAKDIEARWVARAMESWRRVYPESDDEDLKVKAERIRERLHRSNDRLYMALRERYLLTLVPASAVAIGAEDEIAARATVLAHGLLVGQTAAERFDFKIAKRCVERAVVERWAARASKEFAGWVARLVTDEFLRFGIDLTPDELEGDDSKPGAHRPTWVVTVDHVDEIVNDRPHLWSSLSQDLRRLQRGSETDADMRVKVVERLARYLTRPDVLFLPELLLVARGDGIDVENISSEELLPFIDAFWDRPEGEAWIARLREFLRYFTNRPDHDRTSIIDGPIARGAFVRHTVEAENRELLREAFNTPLHPMVLIANEVMQEGLDLHHNCRRIIHHDLAWNPAQLEQRVGRIDRLGSLVRRERERDNVTTLEISYPLIERTIDERMYRTVKAREKWLEFLLGARPNFSEFTADDEPVADLPAELAQSLAVNLKPPRAP